MLQCPEVEGSAERRECGGCSAFRPKHNSVRRLRKHNQVKDKGLIREIMTPPAAPAAPRARGER
jgi:hypothetical protein